MFLKDQIDGVEDSDAHVRHIWLIDTFEIAKILLQRADEHVVVALERHALPLQHGGYGQVRVVGQILRGNEMILEVSLHQNAVHLRVHHGLGGRGQLANHFGAFLAAKIQLDRLRVPRVVHLNAVVGAVLVLAYERVLQLLHFGLLAVHQYYVRGLERAYELRGLLEVGVGAERNVFDRAVYLHALTRHCRYLGGWVVEQMLSE